MERLVDPVRSVSTRPKRSVVVRAVGFVLIYLLVLVVALPHLIPPVPRTKLGWLILCVVAPPLYLVGEWIGGKISEPWGEDNPLLKLLKAAVLISAVLLLMLMYVVFLAGV